MPPSSHYLTVQLYYQPETNRRRDTDNLVATLKPICDALAKGTRTSPGLGLVPDDVPRFMGKPEPIIFPAVKGEPARMWMDLIFYERAPWPYSPCAS